MILRRSPVPGNSQLVCVRATDRAAVAEADKQSGNGAG